MSKGPVPTRSPMCRKDPGEMQVSVNHARLISSLAVWRGRDDPGMERRVPHNNKHNVARL